MYISLPEIVARMASVARFWIFISMKSSSSFMVLYNTCTHVEAPALILAISRTVLNDCCDSSMQQCIYLIYIELNCLIKNIDTLVNFLALLFSLLFEHFRL